MVWPLLWVEEIWGGEEQIQVGGTQGEPGAHNSSGPYIPGILRQRNKR